MLKNLIEAMIKHEAHLFQYGSQKIRGNEGVIYAAIAAGYGCALEHASESSKRDEVKISNILSGRELF